MPVNRRNFIKDLSAFGALSLLPFGADAKQDHADGLKKISAYTSPKHDDERYWAMVRKQFPLVGTRAYMNNGTMGPSPYPVIDAINQRMMQVDSTGEYGGWDESRKVLADFLHVDEAEISLTHNVTDGINIVCWGLNLAKGDEVLVTNHEHVGNALPWLNRASVHELKVNYFELGEDAHGTMENLKKKITSSTKVIAVPHIVCTTGQVQPVQEIIAYARQHGIIVFIDGAHGAGMLNLNLRELDCDYYAGCCHKWLCGAKGTGFLYVKKQAIDSLQPYFVGGGSDSGWNIVDPPSPSLKGYNPTAHRFDFGTQNASLWAGVNAAVSFFNTLGMDKVEARVKYLAGYLQKELLNIKSSNLIMLTPTEERSRGAVIGFKLKNMSYQDFGKAAGEKNFRIRLVAENGLNSVRVSTHIYNNIEEIDQFVAFTGEMLKK
jgi:cysteine desulfurase/selenocysteine lyase